MSDLIQRLRNPELSDTHKDRNWQTMEEAADRIAELERELAAVTRQRDETAEKLVAANQRIQALTFGKN